MRRLAWALSLGLLALTISGGAAQDPVRVIVSNTGAIAPLPTGTGQITGVVIDASTRRPIADALVTLSSSYPAVRVLTDANGRFAFDALPALRFQVSATLPGYAPGAYGRLRPSGDALPIDLADGGRANVSVSLWPLGATAGVVADDRSEPMAGVRVYAYRHLAIAGRRQLVAAGDDETDDRGQYRIGGLEPGAYVVAVPMATFTWPASLEHYMLQGAHYPDALQGLPDRTRDLIGKETPVDCGHGARRETDVRARSGHRILQAGVSSRCRN